MSILRSEYLVALNDLIVACREAAIGHRTAGSLVSDGSLQQALAALGKERESAADTLALAVIAEDDIPNAPSGEKELLEAATARLKSALSPDETRKLLEDCGAREERVAETAAAVLAHDLEEDLRRNVAALRDDTARRMDGIRRDHLSD